MSQYVFKMPDLGEGTVDAEIVAWHTKPGDAVTEDQLIVEVMTDKAAVEVPAPVSGRVISITGTPGDKVAVGSPLIVFEVGEERAPAAAPVSPRHRRQPRSRQPAAQPHRPRSHYQQRRRCRRGGAAPAAARAPGASHGVAGKSPAGPRGRHRSRDGGWDPGPAAASCAPTSSRPPARPAAAGPETSEIKVIGLRRLIAERMSEAKRNIPHFAYVEEVDVTELESLRLHLNVTRPPGRWCLELPAVGRHGFDAGAGVLSAMQCAVRRGARGAGAPPRGACGHRHTNPGWLEGSGGAQCAGVGALGTRRRNPPSRRARAHAARRRAMNSSGPRSP